jgi:dTDP-4-dehydrorhamnose reductase
MKKKVLIFGGTGMLGHMVYKYFSQTDFEVSVTSRTDNLLFTNSYLQFDVLKNSLASLPAKFDFAINCVGAIKHRTDFKHDDMITLNSLWPWKLAEWCDDNDIKLIHITTDCVFSGMKGKYTEEDHHDAYDFYGKSKSLGECSDLAMILRASIIGEEIQLFSSLLSWAKSQKGKSVDGFKNHIWNGVTTYKFAEICKLIINKDLFKKGLFHIFAKDDVSKFDLLVMFNKKFKLNMTINEYYAESIDRSLRTIKPLCGLLQIPSVSDLVDNMDRI